MYCHGCQYAMASLFLIRRKRQRGPNKCKQIQKQKPPSSPTLFLPWDLFVFENFCKFRWERARERERESKVQNHRGLRGCRVASGVAWLLFGLILRLYKLGKDKQTRGFCYTTPRWETLWFWVLGFSLSL
jgi:hypothetical protein